ncbi:HupE/UreJ family protein [Blastopirellula marina]|uniref:HupE/UreJ family protein n=1 Tax=Blastopirellula marina TaxID=124 RepID=UPI001304AE57|nr:HupE/UreJ family protein [Blastopirellula marina]
MGVDELEGFLLQWTGFAPLLATLAVGILAVHVEGRFVIAIPMVFLCGMAVGVGLNGSGIQLPYIHVGLAMTVILSGVALWAAREYPVVISAVALAVVGILHGHADAQAVSASSGPLAFLLGVLLGTALLLGIGVWLGLWMEARTAPSRVFGLVLMVVGIGMLGGAVVT